MAQTGYILCTAPRSGSTLLCMMLQATGVAGAPSSQFYDPSVQDWAADLGVPPGPDLLARIFQAAARAGRGASPVFGLRQQRPSFAFLQQQLQRFAPDAPGDLARLIRAFGPLKFIHLRREDKLEQAISLIRARQSGVWHRGADGAVLEGQAPSVLPGYNADLIAQEMQGLAQMDAGWAAWFQAEGIAPLRLTYEGLARDPLGHLRQVLHFLGQERAAADHVAVPTRKLADATSRAWAQHFQAARP